MLVSQMTTIFTNLLHCYAFIGHKELVCFAGNWRGAILAAGSEAESHAPGYRDLNLSIIGYNSDRRSEPNTVICEHRRYCYCFTRELLFVFFLLVF